MRSILRLSLLITVACSFAVAAICQEPSTNGAWPEWRGGPAQGYSAARHLPVRLDPGGPTMRWKVPVRGRGISSPIVVDGRVFVTTAHRYEGGFLRFKSIAIVAFLALALLAGAIRLLRRGGMASVRHNAEPIRTLVRWLLRVDGFAVIVGE